MKHELFAFISMIFADRVIKHARKACPGCQNSSRNPLSHTHEQLSLYDKFVEYFVPVCLSLREHMPVIVERLAQSRPGMAGNEEIYVAQGINFLDSQNARSLYYGKCVSYVCMCVRICIMTSIPLV